MNPEILIAPNAFKHSLSAIEVAETIQSALKKLNKNLKCEIAPIADGGDGTINIFKFYFKKSKYINCKVLNPLGKLIKSKWLLLNKDTAVIELAKASGLALLKKEELDPLKASTYGTGQLILSALKRGCRNIIVALGGSATVDAGLGILTAFGIRFYDKNKRPLKPSGKALLQIKHIDLSNIDKRILKSKIFVMCDVQSVLYGKNGTINFSKQKGANKKEQYLLEHGMKNYAKLSNKITGKNCSLYPMVGAAGGVAYTLKTYLNARLFNGFIYLSKKISLEEKIKKSDIVITGEGSLDSQTLMGKGVYELAKMSRKHKKKIIVICGNYDKNIRWSNYNVSHIIKIKPESLSLDKSIKYSKKLIKIAIKDNSTLFK